MGRNTRQGLPTATTPAGISLVTTDPAPMTLLSPMVTPGQMTTLPPIQTLLPIRTGLPNSTPLMRGATATGRRTVQADADVVDHDAGTFSGERERVLTPDSATGTRHDDHAAVEQSH